MSNFSSSFKTNINSSGRSAFKFIAFLIASGNLLGCAVAKTILFPFKLILSKAP